MRNEEFPIEDCSFFIPHSSFVIARQLENEAPPGLAGHHGSAR
jgi:hypothetical protein